MRPVNVLLVEDSHADVFLVQEALNAHYISHNLIVLSDGEAALDYVLKMGKSDDKPCPDILLLDLNIPKAGGTEILTEFRRNQDCRDTPVIVVSSSDNLRDLGEVNKLGIAHYFRKPSSYEAFLHLGEIVRNAVKAG